MDSQSSPISSIGVNNNDENNIDFPLSSRINYLAGTTVGLHNPILGRSNLPISQSNIVQPHDHSYSQYMNKDKKTIAKENHFDLQGKTTTARHSDDETLVDDDSEDSNSSLDNSNDDLENVLMDEFDFEDFVNTCRCNICNEDEEDNHN
ncbi:unnamed protein product [Rotaria sp. Silwood2]|nr:unnamed protein product [Rotaria sp. Silwood2]